MNKIDLENIKKSHQIKDVAVRLGLNVRGNGGRCFAHEDSHPSFVFMPDVNRFECKSCGVKGDVFDLVMKVKQVSFTEAVKYLEPLSTDTFKSLNGNEAQQYLDSRGLFSETLEKFGIKINNNRVAIPLSTGKKYRIFGGDFKYIQDKGTEGTIFKAGNADKKIILCEGELDAVKLFQETNYPSWSGTGGAETFKKEWLGEFENIEKIFICYDNDEAGKNGAEKAISILGADRCFKVLLPSFCKDITEFFQMGGTSEEFKILLKNAKSTKTSIMDLIDDAQSSLFAIPSGFEQIDNVVKFEAGNAYLIGGCEKSGKSAFCMNIASHLLSKGHNILYVNTEFTFMEFSNRMSGIYYGIPYSQVDEVQKREYLTNIKDQLQYSGIGSDVIDFDTIFLKLLSQVEKGVKVVFFDNVTTFANNPPPNTDGWKEQARVMNQLKDLAKEKNIVVFVVLHTKDIPVERALITRVKDIIESKDPTIIFNDTVTVMARPTNADLYGGLRIASQFSGSILIWRPFLKFSDPLFNQTSQIIMESFRNAQAGVGFEAIFKGEIPTFELL